MNLAHHATLRATLHQCFAQGFLDPCYMTDLQGDIWPVAVQKSSILLLKHLCVCNRAVLQGPDRPAQLADIIE